MAVLVTTDSAGTRKWDRAFVASKARAVSVPVGRALLAAVVSLKPNILTGVGLGCIDIGAFEANHIVGWFATGVSILLLDWKREG